MSTGTNLALMVITFISWTSAISFSSLSESLKDCCSASFSSTNYNTEIIWQFVFKSQRKYHSVFLQTQMVLISIIRKNQLERWRVSPKHQTWVCTRKSQCQHTWGFWCLQNKWCLFSSTILVCARKKIYRISGRGSIYRVRNSVTVKVYIAELRLKSISEQVCPVNEMTGTR